MIGVVARRLGIDRRYRMIIVRLIGGVAQHFTIRLSEWVMLIPTLGMWLALQIQPHMFSTSRSFTQVASIGPESMWAFTFLIVGASRLAALFINGTFQEFPYSPYVRMAASTIAALCWAQFSLGFVQSYLDDGGAMAPYIAYGTFTVFEIANFYRSSKDIGVTYAETKRRHQDNGLGF